MYYRQETNKRYSKYFLFLYAEVQTGVKFLVCAHKSHSDSDYLWLYPSEQLFTSVCLNHPIQGNFVFSERVTTLQRISVTLT